MAVFLSWVNIVETHEKAEKGRKRSGSSNSVEGLRSQRAVDLTQQAVRSGAAEVQRQRRL